MLKQITMMESGTIRGLLVSMTGIIGLVASLFGVDAAVFGEEANKFIDALMSLLATGGAVYAAYARTTKPTPPLSDTASEKTRELQRKQGGFSSVLLLIVQAFAAIAVSLMMAFAMTGCVTGGVEPQGFTDRAAVAELRLDAVIISSTNLVSAGVLKPAEGKAVRELATSASATLGLAEEAFGAGDVSTAISRLKLAEGVLRELQSRLDVKPVTRSEP